jgi:hypothetical protein
MAQRDGFYGKAAGAISQLVAVLRETKVAESKGA